MEHHGVSGNKQEIRPPCHNLTGNLLSFGSLLPNNVVGKKKKIQYFQLDLKKKKPLISLLLKAEPSITILGHSILARANTFKGL